MRKIMLALGALATATPAAVVLPTTVVTTALVAAPDEAQAQTRRHRTYAYREWRGRDGRTYCRRPNGTVGLVVGAAGGALIGHAIDSHGERTTGTVLGALAGGLLGRHVARHSGRCR